MNPFAGLTILIAGDVMLDEYIWGDARRISPEAPVPVVDVQRRTYATGGAANVAVNVASLGGVPLLCGLVGDDRDGQILRSTLGTRGVETGGLHADASRPTTTKTRILAYNHQIARLDTESRAEPAPALARRLLGWIRAHIAGSDACIISDYAKGVVTAALARQIIAISREAGKPVLVDPKATDFRRYRSATVVTPNLHEACRAAGREWETNPDADRLARRLLPLLDGAALLLTRGAAGMSLYAPGAEPLHVAAEARSVYDVTGAGDTVVCALALGLAAGRSIPAAMQVANRAAGIVVGKIGAASVSPEELFQDLQAEPQKPGPAREDIHSDSFLPKLA